MSNHSKLPWKWDYKCEDFRSAANERIFFAFLNADRDLILKAVNNHYALCDLLEELRNDADVDGCHDDETCDETDCSICKINAVLRGVNNE